MGWQSFGKESTPPNAPETATAVIEYQNNETAVSIGEQITENMNFQVLVPNKWDAITTPFKQPAYPNHVEVEKNSIPIISFVLYVNVKTVDDLNTPSRWSVADTKNSSSPTKGKMILFT